MKKILLFIILIYCLSIHAQIQKASDINQGTIGSSLIDFFKLENNLFFSAVIDNNYNRKLWKTDGTETGTTQINNLPDKGYFVSNNVAYYTTYSEIWKTDGTEIGTHKIKDQVPYLEPLGAFNDYFYYLAVINVNQDVGLHKTNGTNTTLLKTFSKDEYAVNNISNNGNAVFKLDNDRCIIYIHTKNTGIEPYISNGTEAGTYLLKDIVPGSSNSSTSTFHQTNNHFIFINNKKELWSTNGTETGTVKLKEFTGSNSLAILGTTTFNNKVYFAYTHELWETDGTEVGTKLVFSNINSDGGIQAIINRENDLLLLLERGIHIFNGTSNSTTKITTPDISYIRPYHAHSTTKVYFIADYKNEGYRIFTTDGTAIGTTSLDPIWPDSATPTNTMYTLNEKLIFSTGSHLGEYNKGELWISDGTNIGTKMLKDINTAGNINSEPKFQTELNGKIYFSADDNIHGRELMVFDGNSTTLVKDINPGFQSSNPFDFYLLNNKIVFKAYTLENGLELWITDGTETGTKLIKDINPNQGDAFLNDNRSHVRIKQFALLNNQLYFYANNSTNGMEPWKTDGTEEGTVMLKDINSGGNSSFRPALDSRPRFIEYNNELYFYVSKSGADNNLSDAEMWKTNGTSTGTVLVPIVNNLAQAGSITPFTFFTFNNQLYFLGKNKSTRKINLHRTDGTEAGTTTIEDFGSKSYFYPLKDKIYYMHNDFQGAGEELWSIDKNDNKNLVKDIVEGSQGSGATNFYRHKDYLYFTIRNANYNLELWRLSDTTEPEQLLTKQSEDLTYGLGTFFDYFSKDNKLFVINDQVGTNYSYKMYAFENKKPNKETLFTFENSMSYPVNGFWNNSAFLNNTLYFNYNDGIIGEELFSFDLTNVLSINNVNTLNNFDFIIYPNPVQNSLHIQSNFKVKNATIYTFLGEEIEQFSTNKFDVSKYKKGFYILKIEDNLGRIFTKKWIKN